MEGKFYFLLYFAITIVLLQANAKISNDENDNISYDVEEDEETDESGNAVTISKVMQGQQGHEEKKMDNEKMDSLKKTLMHFGNRVTSLFKKNDSKNVTSNVTTDRSFSMNRTVSVGNSASNEQNSNSTRITNVINQATEHEKLKGKQTSQNTTPGTETTKARTYSKSVQPVLPTPS